MCVCDISIYLYICVYTSLPVIECDIHSLTFIPMIYVDKRYTISITHTNLERNMYTHTHTHTWKHTLGC